jgi:hypothetical protein
MYAGEFGAPVARGGNRGGLPLHGGNVNRSAVVRAAAAFAQRVLVGRKAR